MTPRHAEPRADPVELALFNYQYGVTEILLDLLERPDDAAAYEEVTHCLDSRDYLQDKLLQGALLAAQQRRVWALDSKLLSMGQGIVQLIKGSWPEEYRSWRERNRVPESHWWWYLDSRDVLFRHFTDELEQKVIRIDMVNQPRRAIAALMTYEALEHWNRLMKLDELKKDGKRWLSEARGRAKTAQQADDYTFLQQAPELLGQVDEVLNALGRSPI